MDDERLGAFRAALADRYRIDRKLGHGGMSTVYLAHDLKLGRPVALKVLRPEIALSLGHDRFLREIQYAARLSHPNILPLHDSDEAAGALYYVMPFVEGGTVQDRLTTGAQLGLDEAVAITRQIAAGLDHAHQLGLVHRDVKPANILLAGSHVFIMDFGIARAVWEAMTGDQLTETGLAIGTPGYMAPEQLAGSRVVDGRADQFSLACVLYEMLGGASQRRTLDRADDVRRALRTGGPRVPPRIAEAITRALANAPESRFPTVAAFAAELVAADEARRFRLREALRRVRPARAALGVGVPLAAAVVLWLVAGGRSARTDEVLPDTSRYAILPFEYQAETPVINEAQLLHDALTRWRGLSVADPFQLREALGRRSQGPLTNRAAVDLAREVGAGRYLRGEVSRIGDSLRVRVGLYDGAGGGELLAERTVRLPGSLAGAESSFAVLADRLLFRGSLPEGVPALSATRSLPARQAVARAQQALEAWALARADSAFAEAAALDPSYGEAHLWVALVRAWSGADPARWRTAAEQAALHGQALSARDQAMSDAVLAEAREDYGAACPRWQRLTEREPRDFAAWYGWAHCLTSDDVVLPDSRSPSGWRFRASYQAATQAYERAFQLLPSIHRAFRAGSYESLRRLLMTSASAQRPGRAPAPDSATFAAYPSWQGDTLAFVPYAPQQILAHPWASATTTEAIRRQREQFREIAVAWVTASPGSADAVEALAVALELLGDPAALDTLRRARALAGRPDERVRMAAAEVWLRVKFSAPSDIAGLHDARQLADSLLMAHRGGAPPEPQALAALAALTGRANLAAALSRPGAQAPGWEVAEPVARAGVRLLAFAALGGPEDSLRALEREVRGGIARMTSAPARRRAYLQWWARPASLAFPDYPFPALPEIAGGDYVVDAQTALRNGQRDSVTRLFTDLRASRRFLAPSELTLDGLYPEARLLAAVGDDRGAVAWLDPTLAALAAAPPQARSEPADAGALVRAMALRAELAARLGDQATAASWAAAVAELWSDADPFLQPMVRRMRSLAAMRGMAN